MKKSKKSLRKPLKGRKKKKEEEKQVQHNFDHIPEKLRNMIVDDVSRFKKIMGSTKYKVRVLYSDAEDNEDVGITNQSGETSTVAASTQISLPYLTVDLRIHPFLISGWKEGFFTDDDVHDIIAHEIAHIATHRLYQLAVAPYKTEEETKNSWEELTTMLGRMLYTIDEMDSSLTNSK